MARYARNDELGVPYAVTFDFETMEEIFSSAGDVPFDAEIFSKQKP